MNSGFRLSYSGFNTGVLTFRYDGLVEPGDLVTMYGSAKVRRAEENEEFIGKVITVDSDFAAVQLVGYVECVELSLFPMVMVGYWNQMMV